MPLGSSSPERCSLPRHLICGREGLRSSLQETRAARRPCSTDGPWQSFEPRIGAWRGQPPDQPSGAPAGAGHAVRRPTAALTRRSSSRRRDGRARRRHRSCRGAERSRSPRGGAERQTSPRTAARRRRRGSGTPPQHSGPGTQAGAHRAPRRCSKRVRREARHAASGYSEAQPEPGRWPPCSRDRAGISSSLPTMRRCAPGSGMFLSVGELQTEADHLRVQDMRS